MRLEELSQYFDSDGICKTCGGAGNVWSVKDQWFTEICPVCKGKGELRL